MRRPAESGPEIGADAHYHREQHALFEHVLAQQCPAGNGTEDEGGPTGRVDQAKADEDELGVLEVGDGGAHRDEERVVENSVYAFAQDVLQRPRQDGADHNNLFRVAH